MDESDPDDIPETEDSPKEDAGQPGEPVSNGDAQDDDDVRPPSGERSDPGGEANMPAQPTPSDLPAGREGFSERERAAMLAIVKSFKYGARPLSKRETLRPKAFELDEDLLVRIEKRVAEQFQALHIPPFGPVIFLGSVRFTDLTTEDFNSMEELRDSAAEQRDPEALFLEWRAFLSDFSEASVSIHFVTEQRMEADELSLLEFEVASMRLEVGGPTREWVTTTFDALLSHIKSAEIGGIYKPLLLFRNKDIVHLASYVIAVIAQVVSYIAVADALAPRTNSERMAAILRETALPERFEEFIRDTFTQPTQARAQLVPALASVATLVGAIFAGFFALPKLVPRSTIEIGLARRRLARYKNTFRFVVFNLLLLGLIIPLALTILD